MPLFQKGHPGGPGGARPGSGRKPRHVRYEAQVGEVEEALAKNLPQSVKNIVDIANGGLQRIEEELVLASTLMMDGVAKHKNGKVILDAKGNPIKIKVPMYPNAGKDEMVVVRRKVTILERDLVANTYIVDTFLPKLKQAVEITGEDGNPIDVNVRGDTQLTRTMALLGAVRARRNREGATGGGDSGDTGTASPAADR